MNTLVLAPFSDDGLTRLAALGHVVHEPWTETRTLWDPEELGARLTDEGFDALAVEADFLLRGTVRHRARTADRCHLPRRPPPR